MEKKSRPQASGNRRAMRIATIATLSVAVVAIGIAFAVTIANNSSRPVASSQSSSAPGTDAPAAGGINFQPTHELGAGQVEGLPAGAVKEGDNPNLLAAGTLAPDFTLSTATGARISLSRLRGKTVLLEFSATWCPHCQAEAPHLKQIMASLPVESFTMISVNADGEDAASLAAFDRYFGITTPTLLDPGSRPGNYYHQGASGPVTQTYKVAIFPTFYIIDPKGLIAWRADHEQPDALLLQKLKNASGS
ncbi:MAG TPA: TlpA disulfide reductase family protein [Spirochaetia bacterium]|nr:TlpA disulfide reductase family protein [Spirochaetia bacterium]